MFDGQSYKLLQYTFFRNSKKKMQFFDSKFRNEFLDVT